MERSGERILQRFEVLKIRQEVVPLILTADKRRAVNLNIKTHPCETPSCLMSHASDINQRQGWYDQFTDWQEKLWQYDQGLWSGLFGVAVRVPSPSA